MEAMTQSDLKCDSVPQSCRQPLFYWVGLLTGQAAAVPAAYPAVPTAGYTPPCRPVCAAVFMVDNLDWVCNIEQRMFRLFISFNVSNTHIFVCVCVCIRLCLEESGGLGTVWKSYWASSGPSQSHGKQHRPKTTKLVHAAAWPPTL